MKKIKFTIKDYTLARYYPDDMSFCIYTKEIVKEAWDLLPNDLQNADHLFISVTFPSEQMCYGYSFPYSMLDKFTEILDELSKLL
jgi:hypothetical protein